MERDDNKQYLKNVVSLILLLAAVIVAFGQFTIANRKRVFEESEKYIQGITEQRIKILDSLFAKNLSYIRSMAFLYSMDITSDGTESDSLNFFESGEGFDYLTFIDTKGINYSSEGASADVSDRDYYIEGMKGSTGMTYVDDSRISEEIMIGFYTPVYHNGEIVGVMAGFYGEDYIRELLDFDVFGFSGDGWLCASDGTIIFTTADHKDDDFFYHIENSGKCTKKELENIHKAFSTNENYSYKYSSEGNELTGYIANFNDTDWVLVRSFPNEAAEYMSANANKDGVKLMILLIMLFALYAAFIIVSFIRQRKRTAEENRNANDISQGVQQLFEKFQAVDLETGRYSYIFGVPDDKNLEVNGDYDSFCKVLLMRIKDEAERKEAAAFFDLENLKRRFDNGAEHLSIRIHAPIYGNEWFNYNFVPLDRESEHITRMLIIRQNVTSLIMKEEQAKQDLKKAYEAAERANKAKTRFLSNMSHDIRTPMNAIIGFTNIAKSKIDEKDMVSESLEKISTSSEHLLSLINDILDMSKIESGKIQLNPHRVDLRESLKSLSDIVRSQVTAKRINLVTDTEGLIHPFVMVDGLRLDQVLLNIIGNSIKYTPNDGSITVKMTEEEQAPGRSVYFISVKDTGIGMSKEYLPHVFESFTRERTSTIDKIQGTGLGMAISDRIVRLMKGSISVNSEPGKGTLFEIRLPLEYLDPPEESEEEKDKEARESISFDNVKVLLVEDNDLNAQIANFILSEHGFIVDRAENGSKAVDMMREKGPDNYRLVLMDIQMPVMDGYEACRNIRALSNGDYTKIPIIAMTANTFDDDKKNALEAGMNAHIAKPLNVDEMLETLAEFLSAGGDNGDKERL